MDYITICPKCILDGTHDAQVVRYKIQPGAASISCATHGHMGSADLLSLCDEAKRKTERAELLLGGCHGPNMSTLHAHDDK